MKKLWNTYRNLFRRTVKFITDAPDEWKKIAEEHPIHRECMTDIFLPMLVFEIIAAIITILFQESFVEIEKIVFQSISIVLRTVGGYYFVTYLAYRWIEYFFPSTYLRDDCEKVIAYGFMILMLVDTLVLITGNMLILYILYIGIAYEFLYAFRWVIDCNDRLRFPTMAIFTIMTIAIPNFLRLLFKILLPKAPI